MAADFYWKRHDTGPAAAAQLAYSDGTNPDLSGGSVKFVMTVGSQQPPKVNATAVIVNAVAGIVSYTPIAADTSLPGDYNVEWEVTLSGGQKISFPDPGYQSLTVTPDLNDA